MKLEKLRDQVAAAVFVALLQRDGHADVNLIAAEAWETAGAFLDNRPSRLCKGCVQQMAEKPP